MATSQVLLKDSYENGIFLPKNKKCALLAVKHFPEGKINTHGFTPMALQR